MTPPEEMKKLIPLLPVAVGLAIFLFIMYFFSADLRRIINTFIKEMFKKCFPLSQ